MGQQGGPISLENLQGELQPVSIWIISGYYQPIFSPFISFVFLKCMGQAHLLHLSFHEEGHEELVC